MHLILLEDGHIDKEIGEDGSLTRGYCRDKLVLECSLSSRLAFEIAQLQFQGEGHGDLLCFLSRTTSINTLYAFFNSLR